jgi:hypothetical protein
MGTLGGSPSPPVVKAPVVVSLGVRSAVLITVEV